VVWAFLHSKGEFERKKGMHVFAATGETVIPVLAHIAQHMPHNLITFDSMSAAPGLHRPLNYDLPLSIGKSLLFGASGAQSTPNITQRPCDCHACSLVTDISVLRKETAAYEAIALLYAHNLQMTKRYTLLCEALAPQPELLQAAMQTLGRWEKVEPAVRFVDEYLEKGFDYAYARIKNIMAVRDRKSNTQKTLAQL